MRHKLLACTGLTLSDSSIQDLIVRFFIELGEYDPDIYNSYLDLHNQSLLSECPELVDEYGVMPWLDVMDLLIADQIHDRFLIRLRDARFDELSEQQEHLLFRKGPAVEQDLADGQDLTVGKARLIELLQTVAFRTPVIDD